MPLVTLLLVAVIFHYMYFGAEGFALPGFYRCNNNDGRTKSDKKILCSNDPAKTESSTSFISGISADTAPILKIDPVLDVVAFDLRELKLKLLDIEREILAAKYCITISGFPLPEIAPEGLDSVTWGYVMTYKRIENIEKLSELLVAFQSQKILLLQQQQQLVTASQPVISNRQGVHEEFSAVWSAILKGIVVSNNDEDGDTRRWQLQGGVKWIGGIEVLYNRKCYDLITEEISSLSCALIRGTAGIGKTMYLQILLVRLAAQAKERNEDLPSIHYMRKFRGGVETLSFQHDGTVKDVTGIEMNSYPQYLLSDSVDIEYPYATTLNIEVASDAKANYKEFLKRIDESGTQSDSIIMPLWSLAELMCIKPEGMDEHIALFRYNVFGGSARNFKAVQKKNKAKTCPVYSVVEDTMSFAFPDMRKTQLETWEAMVSQISTKLFDRKTKEDGISVVNSMMVHTATDGTSPWASPYMSLLAAAILDDRETSIWSELQKVILASGRGNWFEALGHRKLLTSTIPFLIKPLLQNKPNVFPPIMPRFEKRLFTSKTVAYFHNISDISKLTKKHYGLPFSQQFPLIDAVVQPDTLLQFTISPVAHKGSNASLADIRKHLYERDYAKHKMIFVIPYENIDTFKYHTDLKDIKQYMCVNNPSAVNQESLLNPWEKKRWRVASHSEETIGEVTGVEEEKLTKQSGEKARKSILRRNLKPK